MRKVSRFGRVHSHRSLAIQAAVSTVLGVAPLAMSQSVHTWTGGGTDDLWSNGSNWTASTPDGNNELHFAGTTRLTPNNDTTLDGYRIFFDTGAGAFTLGGNAITLFNFSTNNPKIENSSVSTQTINMAITLDGDGAAGTSAEINPVQGDLVFGSTVTLADPGNTQLRIFGNNGKTVTFNGAISGGNSIAINQASNVVFKAANTYTGDTFVNAGTLQFQLVGSSASSIVRLGDISGTAAATVNLSEATGGQTIGSTLVVRPGSSGLKTLKSTNTSGTNTYSGNIFLDADVTVSSDNSTATFALTGSTIDLKNQTMTVSGAGSTTISGNLQNPTGGETGKLTKSGAGVLTLSGTNTYRGATTINGGVVSVSADNNLGAAPGAATAGQLALNGGSLNATSGFTLNSNRGILLGASNGTVNVASAADTLSYGGIIAGAGTLNKTGSGVLTLSGASTFTGKTFVNAGTLSVAADNNLGAAPGTATDGQVTFAGGTLRATSSFTLATNRNVAFNTGGGTYDVASGATLTVNGVQKGAGGYNKSGPGTVAVVSTASTVTGPISVTGGTLQIASSGAIGGTGVGAGNITLDGGAFRNAASGAGITFLTGNRSFIIGSNGGTIDVPVDGANIQIYTNGAITGVGNTLTKSGPGTFRNTTPTSITFSKLVVTGGLYQAAADNIFGAVPATFTADAIFLNGGGVAFNSGFTYDANRGITLGASGGTISTSSSGTLLTGIAGTAGGSLNKVGSAGAFSISGASTFDGPTNFFAGRINAQATNALSTGQINFPAAATSGGTLANNVAATVTLPNAFLLSSAQAIDISANSGGTLILSGKISGASAWKRDNASTGTLTLSNSTNDFSGAFTVSSGQVAVTANNALGTTAGATTVVSAASLVITGGVNYSTAEPLSIAGPGNAVSAGAINSPTGANTFAGPITMTAASTINVAANSLTLSGNIGGAFAVTKTGNGTLALSGTNGYTGATTVSAGTLQVGGGTTSGSIDPTGGIVNNASVAFNRSDTYTYTGVISGTGNFYQNGSGTTALSATQTYSGATTINAGNLSLTTGANRLPTNTAVTLNGGTLLLNGNDHTVGSTAGSAGTISLGAATFTTGGSNTSSSFSGSIVDSGGVVKAGSGTFTLGGANSYTGGSTINLGTVVATSNSALGTGSVVVGSGVANSKAALLIGGLSGGTSIGNDITTNSVADPTDATYALAPSSVIGGQNTSGVTTFTGPVTVNGTSGVKLTAAAGGQVNFTNSFSGTEPRLFKEGAGTVQLSAFSFVGAPGFVWIREGTLALATGGDLLVSTGNLTLGDGGTTAAAAFILNNSTGGQTFTGPVYPDTNSNGTNRIVGGSNTSGVNTFTNIIGGAGAGQRTVALTAAAGGIVDFTGEIGNTGIGINKIGAGTVRLSAVNGNPLNGTIGGYGTTVSEGTLLLNNTFGSATGSLPVLVKSGATLGGTGAAAGSVTIDPGGTLAPGASIETLDTGSLSFADGTSNYLIELDADTPAADRTNVTGTVALGGAALQISFTAITAGTHGNPQTFVIINNDAGEAVTGAFGAISAPPFAQVVVDYAYSGTDSAGFTADGNDVAINITYVPEPSAMATGLVGLTSLLRRRRR